MKFYPADWRADPMLRVCSIGARGLWMEMLSLMHESERYGCLLINGKAPNDRQLAALAGIPIDELSSLQSELEDQGVFSRDRNGTIYSRRMIRDEKKAEHARKIGKKGGNPTLGKQKDNSAQDKGQDNQQDNGGVKAQIPEARVQKEERDSNLPPDLRAILSEGGYATPPGDLALLKRWYEAGADLEQDILPTIRRVRTTLSKAPFTLKVFDPYIREKLAADAAEIERLKNISRKYERDEQERAAAGGRA